MQRGQWLDSLSNAVDIAMRGTQGRIWTALPGIIQSFDATALTCSVQPAIQGTLANPKTGNADSVNLPLLVDCPVQFPSGGGVTLTMPIAAGDECLVIFASRCIDAWWQSGKISPPMVYRMHDLSDGFVIPGVWSQARKLTGVSTTKAQLRSTDGTTHIELDPATSKVAIAASGGVTIVGDVTVTGTITASGDVTGNGTSLHTHVHTDPQGGNTGGPV